MAITYEYEYKNYAEEASMKRVLMIASENDGLEGCKVGGIGDVVRDIPPVLARQGYSVDVAVPSYGFLHRLPGSEKLSQVEYRFGGKPDSADVYTVGGKKPTENVRHVVVDHPAFSQYDEREGKYQIYVNDPSSTPFASDATKFARFCMAMAATVKERVLGEPDCIHLHDWHASLFLLLRKNHSDYECLRAIRTAFTIHNLSIQGVRPIKGHASALKTWYPDLDYKVRDVIDPRWLDCINPMAVGIRLSDAVHSVSASYVEEICISSNRPSFIGGEGLERDLQTARNHGNLYGIINGCDYPPDRQVLNLSFSELVSRLESEVSRWIKKQTDVSDVHTLALKRLEEWRSLYGSEGPKVLLTSVSRITDQKMLLLLSQGTNGTTALRSILDYLQNNEAVYILLGTGTSEYEEALLQAAAQSPNFVFLNGYSDSCANDLYASGDLFLMPSSFEPCGISQMLAMRDGQPCVVHAVGGLRDTVRDGISGFVFSGDTIEKQADNFMDSCRDAVELKLRHPNRWKSVCEAASKERFLWDRSAKEYIDKLYEL